MRIQVFIILLFNFSECLKKNLNLNKIKENMGMISLKKVMYSSILVILKTKEPYVKNIDYFKLTSFF